jgi:hypothetical protein
VHGIGNFESLQADANKAALTGDIDTYIKAREQMDALTKKPSKKPGSKLSNTQSQMTEAASVNLLYTQPEEDDVRGLYLVVECACGKIRYGSGYKCRCGAETDDIRGYRVQEKYRKLTENKLASKTCYWYHSTTNKDWAEVIQSANVPVHLGTEQAAFERATADISTSGGEKYYVFKIKLKPFARIANNVCPDLYNKWSTNLDDFEENTRGRDFVRYVNTYEDSGSVSLFGNPQMFDVIDMTEEIGY